MFNSNTDVAPKTQSGDGRISLDEVREYMLDHYHEALSIDGLAQLTGLSPNYVGEAFKKAYGKSIMDYQTELRIGVAKQLLRDSDLILRDIARKVGYSDEFYFSRRFKKEVGMSPSAYRSDRRKRVAVFSASTIGNLVPLGVVPVAAPIDPKWSPYYHYYYQAQIKVHLNSLDSAPDHDEDNFRMLLSAKPDLLITEDALSDAMLRLLTSAGIEVVRIEANDWREQLRETARALGMQAKSERWIQDYESRAAETRKSINQVVGHDVFVALRLCGDQLYLYCNQGIRDVLVRDLGLLTYKQGELCNEPITLNDLYGINPDRIFMLICSDGATWLHWLALQSRAEWRGLNAVSRGQVYPIPSNPWFEYSATAVHRMMEEAHLMLTGKNPTDSPAPVHGDMLGALL